MHDEPQRHPHDRSAIPRRTALAAAGWAVPAVGLAVATPAHAASGTTRTLRLTVPPPAARPGGSDLSDVTATLRADGSPEPGQRILLAVSGSAAFPGGATTRIGTTDGNGQVAATGLTAATSSGRVDLVATTLDVAPPLSDAGSLEIVQAEQPTIDLVVPPPTTRPAGASLGDLTATLTEGGRPVVGRAVTIRVDGGAAAFPGGAASRTEATDATGRVTATGLTAGATGGDVVVTAVVADDATTTDTERVTIVGQPTGKPVWYYFAKNPGGWLPLAKYNAFDSGAGWGGSITAAIARNKSGTWSYPADGTSGIVGAGDLWLCPKAGSSNPFVLEMRRASPADAAPVTVVVQGGRRYLRYDSPAGGRFSFYTGTGNTGGHMVYDQTGITAKTAYML